MERKAVELAVVGWVLLVSACADGEDGGADGSSSGPDLGSESGTSTGPVEPPPTSASESASTSITTGDPDESSGGSSPDTDGDEDSGSGSSDTGEPVGDLDCSTYCSIYMDACQDYSEYANAQHCLDHCGQWPIGAVEDTAADSLGCRTYHVTVASSTDPHLHCPHSGPSGEATCVDADAPTCDLYCTRYFSNCTDDLNLWADMDMCLAQCGLWYAGSVADTVGHTIGCRAYYANLAAGDAEANCIHAGPGGGEQCVLASGG
jgi:hypothetical protein